MDPARDPDLAGVTALVRERDRPRYYAALFAPGAIRSDLLVLYGFAAEMARIPDLVTEPALGEIRLQFWRDQVEGLAQTGGAGGPPLLRALAGVVARHRLRVDPLLALIDAHRFDLYSDPPASFTEVEGYLGETQSALFQMAAIVAGGTGPETADLAGHAGVAYGLSRRLANIQADRMRGRTLLPHDLLAAEGLSAADAFAADPSPALAPTLKRMAALGRNHLRRARQEIGSLRPELRAVFLPLAVVEPLLDRVERRGRAIMTAPVALSDLETLTRITWARLKPPGKRVAADQAASR